MTDTGNTGRLNDDDMTSKGPTESKDNLDQGGEGPKDTGDETTESGEDRDQGGDGPKDTGDQ
jgi:hypothetical protein